MASLNSDGRDPWLDSTLHALLQKRGREFLGVVALVLAALCAVMLGTFAPEDPSWLTSTETPVRNGLGRIGAGIASPLMLILGKASWGLVIFLAGWGLRLITGHGHELALARAVFAPIALAVTAIWCATLLPPAGWDTLHGLGGIFGDTVLGAVVNALPMTVSAGVTFMGVAMLFASLGLWSFVMGVDRFELVQFLRYVVSGTVLAYAGCRAALGGGLSGMRTASVAVARKMDDGRRAHAQAREARVARAQAAAQGLAGQGFPGQGQGQGHWGHAAPFAPEPGLAAYRGHVPGHDAGYAPGFHAGFDAGLEPAAVPARRGPPVIRAAGHAPAQARFEGFAPHHEDALTEPVHPPHDPMSAYPVSGYPVSGHAPRADVPATPHFATGAAPVPRAGAQMTGHGSGAYAQPGQDYGANDAPAPSHGAGLMAGSAQHSSSHPPRVSQPLVAPPGLRAPAPQEQGGLLGRLKALSGMPAQAPQELRGVLVEPPISAAALAVSPVVDPRISSRISDAIRSRRSAKTSPAALRRAQFPVSEPPLRAPRPNGLPGAPPEMAPAPQAPGPIEAAHHNPVPRAMLRAENAATQPVIPPVIPEVPEWMSAPQAGAPLPAVPAARPPVPSHGVAPVVPASPVPMDEEEDYFVPAPHAPEPDLPISAMPGSQVPAAVSHQVQSGGSGADFVSRRTALPGHDAGLPSAQPPGPKVLSAPLVAQRHDSYAPQPHVAQPAMSPSHAPQARAPGSEDMPRRVVLTGAKKLLPSRQAQAEAQPALPLDGRPEVVFELPPLALLEHPEAVQRFSLSDEALEENARMLENVLDDYGVRGEIVSVRPGPVVTQYELEPAPGLKASRVIGLADDIARSMSALSARVSTVPGRSIIGIELPNVHREKVVLREILSARDYGDANMRLPLALGKGIDGEPIVANLAKMPHLLIAGTTGSGKSVAINTMILSLLYRLPPDECRMIMIDPKMLELSVYDGIPHLLSPVVTDPKKAVVALKWVVGEMEERYRKMSKMGVRNIEGYNGRVREALDKGEMFKRTIQTGFDDETGDPVFETEEFAPERLPFIVVIVDEMADLMMVAGKEIEACIQRLAQMARASGIHLIMATQRPSVDVITGTIKANFPTRISFQVTSKIDSRTILGEQGAEQLLGMGDMLYMAGGGRISRIHGPFVSDEEVEEVVTHLKSFGPPDYKSGVVEGPEEGREADIDAVLGLGGNSNGEDALYDQAVQVVIQDRKCSTSYIQRKLGIGYNKAARLVEQMEDEGLVTAANHVGKREILVPEQG